MKPRLKTTDVDSLRTKIHEIAAGPGPALVEAYYNHPRIKFAAELFDKYGENPPDRFVPDDLVAASLLDVRFGPESHATRPVEDTMRDNAKSVLYRCIDHGDPAALSPKVIDIMCDEIRALDAEIRTALRATSNTYALGVVALAFAVSLVKDVSGDVAIPGLLLLLSVAASWNFLNACDIAVLAEVRDRLAYRVNAHFKKPVMLQRIAGDIRRGSVATTALNGLLATSYAGLAVGAISYALARANDKEPPPLGGYTYATAVLVEVIMTALVIGLSYREVGSDRRAASTALDQIFTERDRPESARDW